MFFRGLFLSMYLLISPILLSLLSESELRYKKLIINVLCRINLYIFVLRVNSNINRLMYGCMLGIAYLAIINP